MYFSKGGVTSAAIWIIHVSTQLIGKNWDQVRDCIKYSINAISFLFYFNHWGECAEIKHKQKTLILELGWRTLES